MPHRPTTTFYALALLGLTLLLLAGLGQSFAGGSPDATADGEPNAEPRGDEPIFTPEQLRTDLDQLYRELQQAHFDLFVHTPKEVYDRHHRQLRAELDRPLTLSEARTRFQRFMAVGDIGHARIDTPDAAFAEFRDGGGKTAPFYFRVEDGRAFVTERYGDSALRLGDEILTLEGEPMAAWLERLASHISAESDYLAHTLLEFRFPQLLWREIGERDRLTLGVRSADGDKRTVSVRSLSREALLAATSGAPERLELDWNERSFDVLDGGIAYLRPGPFYEPTSVGGYDPTLFRATVDAAFERFLEADAADLVIDLRNNPGGDNSFSDLMVAWFADEPFRFSSAFRVKVSPQTTASHRRRLEANPNLAGGPIPFSEIYEAHDAGAVVDIDLPYAEPREGRRFGGEVYVLINRFTFSNGVTVAALVQDFGLGTILGEKTADVATSYGAMEHFTLAETGLLVGYPKAHLVRPNGDTRLRGVTPDIAIETPLIQGAEDPVLRRALEIVEGRRRAKAEAEAEAESAG